MIKKGFLKKLTNKLALLLAVIATISLSSFIFVACNEKPEDKKEKEITYTSTDTKPISNMDFTYGTENLSLDKFPYSPSYWSKASDNSATSSQVNSGTINISEDGWNQLMKTLSSDSDWLAYVKSKVSDYSSKTDEGKKQALIDAGIVKPEIRSDAKDAMVYMLNNYLTSSNIGLGTAQMITSTSTVTLKKATACKVSVWVMTQNIVSNNPEFGANIRLTNSIGGTNQAQYRINNINTNGEWKQFNLYVKADEDFDSTFTLVLGLGYGNGSAKDALDFVEGTVYFDDVSYEEIEVSDIPSSAIVSNMVFGSTDVIKENANGFDYVYDMTFNSNYFETFTPNLAVDKTQSKKSLIGTEPYTVGTSTITGSTVTLNETASTLTITSDEFVLSPETGMFVKFDIENNLSKFNNTSVLVSIIDRLGEVTETRQSILTLDKTEDETVKTVYLLIKNNFIDGEDREFDISLNFGPTANELTDSTKSNELAKGSIKIDNFEFKKFNTNEVSEDKEYSFFNTLATSQSLYAGYSSDYSKDADKTYSLQVASGNIGEIINYPTNAQNYQAIDADHIYVRDNGAHTKINTRSGEGETTFGHAGNAGLINTKYFDNYLSNIGIDVESAFGSYDEDIQALMIYNKDPASYGFIGNSTTISSSSYAKISLKVRVVDSAFAHIALVDVSGQSKDILTFANFTDNKGNEIDGSKLTLDLIVKNANMDTDGWLTVNFYVATGKTEKQVRLEIWNGNRDNQTKSAGFVFVKDIEVTTSSAFTEPTRYQDAFTSTSNPLGQKTLGAIKTIYAFDYTQKETTKTSYIWAKADDMVYAVYNTVDAVPETETEEDEDATSGCSCVGNTDPSSFWLGFSSILLAAVLLLAIIALIVKKIVAKISANKSDAVVHYQVKSRNKTHSENKKNKTQEDIEETQDDTANEEIEETIEESEEEASGEETEETEEANETEEKTETLDDYVYGEVTDFSQTETNEDVEKDETPTETEAETETPSEEANETNQTETTEENKDQE